MSRGERLFDQRNAGGASGAEDAQFHRSPPISIVRAARRTSHRKLPAAHSTADAAEDCQRDATVYEATGSVWGVEDEVGFLGQLKDGQGAQTGDQ
jgi:hypothetical protein